MLRIFGVQYGNENLCLFTIEHKMGAQLQTVLLKSRIYVLLLQTVTQHFFEKSAVIWGRNTNKVQICVLIGTHD